MPNYSWTPYQCIVVGIYYAKSSIIIKQEEGKGLIWKIEYNRKNFSVDTIAFQIFDPHL